MFPYAAVVEDALMFQRPWHGSILGAVSSLNEANALFSLPLDLAIDTILLPVDLVRWAMFLHEGTPIRLSTRRDLRANKRGLKRSRRKSAP